MAVVEMSRLNLAAMSYDKDDILNVLQRTGAAEIKLHSQTEYASSAAVDCEKLRAYLSETESALGELCRAVESYNKQEKIKAESGEVDISYSEFMSARDKKDWADALVGEINAVGETKRKLEAELSKVRRDIVSAQIYSEYKEPLKLSPTAHTKFRLGTIPARQKENLLKQIADVPLASYSFECETNDSALILIAAHKCDAQKADDVLQSVSFTACPFNADCTGEELYSSLREREEKLGAELRENNAQWAKLSDSVRDLKIYCDYVAFELEKAEAAEKMMFTASTFLLEAYVPKYAEELVKGALNSSDKPVYYEFSEPAEDEEPPTLLKNNKVVKNFEAVTNMYSPPSPKEFDPNTVMAFFYSVFLGFIMADMGYGLMMILGGGFLLYKNSRRENMIKSLGGVFAVGGIFTVMWGFLFNSFFGFALLPFTVMPDLQGAEMSWSLAGINVPALLIVSMLIGVVQLGTGYVCKAVQCWRRGEILDGIFDGIVWAVFSVGVELAIVGFVEQFNLPILRLVGGITAGASLLIAVLTAGRKEKLLGKFTKGFGSAYGVINYASDILSYARLYGLMLAGAVIADIITSNSVSLMTSGNFAFIILGVAIMLIGHVFNLAIGLLGAYIHDARLQYVEFYGRFYEGEGRLFTPLGSEHKYIIVTN